MARATNTNRLDDVLGPITLYGGNAGVEYNFCEKVPDRTPPVITCPANIVVECTNSLGNAVGFAVTASDDSDTNVTVVCTPSSGSAYSLGTTTVVCIATDSSGNTNTCS